jgi:hypothetical protein
MWAWAHEEGGGASTTGHHLLSGEVNKNREILLSVDA